MNKKDIDRLIRLQKLVDAIPFSASGTATQTGVGAVQYEQDARAFRPVIKGVLFSMVMEHHAADPDSDFELEWDFDDPDRLLDAMEQWVRDRKVVNWKNAAEWSFERYMDKVRESYEQGD